ncbi:MAG: signal recognition particle receptor subunit alpha [Ignavibacteria bacterium]|nr:signal recognition particle receptor subunit alpha [Ignavibacteria bacterium]
MSFLDKIGFKKLKDGLFKTKENLVDRVNRLVNARGVIDDDFLAELEEILISSDIGFDTSETLINNIRERTQRDKYTDQKELNELINDEIKKVFVKSAVAKNIDVVIIDTAGRLHNKSHLMEELKKIKRVMQKVNPDAPQETFIVIDSTTGQNGLNQAKEFSKALDGLTGIILTKLDGTAKGGIVLKINKEMNLPVRFIGVGEQIDDLQVFDSMSFVEAMFEK